MLGFWAWVASNAVVATGLAAAVALAARLWRNSAVLHLLWMLVLAKLFTPPLVVIPVAGLAAAPRAVEPVATADSTRPGLSAAVRPVEVSSPTDGAISPPANSESVREPVAARRDVSWHTAAALAWLLGTAAGASVCGWRVLAFGRCLRRHTTLAPQAVADVAERLARELGLRRPPEILTLPARIPPMVWLAGRRARVILPTGLVETLSPAALEAVVLHELAHVRRRDGLAQWLEMIATTVFWWHPVAWWARREMRLLEELCCDAMVVRAMPWMAKDYAAALVDTLDFLSTPSRIALPAGAAPWRATSIARRIEMLKRPNMGRITAGRAALVAAIAVVPMAVVLAAGSGEKNKPQPPSAEKAELMGRVMWTMQYGGRDVTAMKAIEWGDPTTDEKGNRSIRCKYYATIWDREVMIMNSVFTFDPKGYPVSMKHVEGFPKPHVQRKFDTTTKNGMIELVQDFFTKNFRDVTSRNTIEWGDPVKGKDGNVSIRYKYEATIWDKDVKIMNQVFTFSPEGKFVDYKNVEGFPRDKPKEGWVVIDLDKDGNISLDGDKVSEEQLAKELKRFATVVRKDKKSTALIKWDTRCSDKKAERLIKLCTDAGMTHHAVLPVDVNPPAGGHQLPAVEAR